MGATVRSLKNCGKILIKFLYTIGGYAKFTGLKTYNKNLKTLLAIGGWNEGSTRFSSMVASRERRKEFVRNAIKVCESSQYLVSMYLIPLITLGVIRKIKFVALRVEYTDGKLRLMALTYSDPRWDK